MSDRLSSPPPPKKRSADALSPMPDTSSNKRFKLDLGHITSFSPQAVTTIGPSLPPLMKTGTEFTQAAAALRDGGNEMVSTQFSLRVKGPDKVTGKAPPKTIMEPERRVKVQGTLSVMQSSGDLTQGWLNTPSNTAYVGGGYNSSVLPVNLSMQRATLESRAIKALSPGVEHYDASAKLSTLDELTLNREKSKKTNSFFPEKNTLGIFAVASHLEDITAKRSMGLENVGSAMRAKLMATKWKMRVDSQEAAGKGFQEKMLNEFPQLGKKDLRAAGLEHSGVSKLKDHWAGSDGTFSKEKQIENITKAHEEARDLASEVFTKKIASMVKGNAPSGKWWTSHTVALQPHVQAFASDDDDRRQQAHEALTKIGEQYVERKLDRHGIRRI